MLGFLIQAHPLIILKYKSITKMNLMNLSKLLFTNKFTRNCEELDMCSKS